jgi:hypothetical protein
MNSQKEELLDQNRIINNIEPTILLIALKMLFFGKDGKTPF